MVGGDEVGRGCRVVLPEAGREEADERVLLACGELYTTWITRWSLALVQ